MHRVIPGRNVVHDKLALSGFCNAGPGGERECARRLPPLGLGIR